MKSFPISFLVLNALELADVLECTQLTDEISMNSSNSNTYNDYNNTNHLLKYKIRNTSRSIYNSAKDY